MDQSECEREREGVGLMIHSAIQVCRVGAVWLWYLDFRQFNEETHTRAYSFLF